MKKIEQKYVDQLLAAGLLVSKPFPEGHAWESGVRVMKPSTTRGNCISDFEFYFGEILIDAPTVVLYFSGTSWFVLMQEHIPTADKGDFENRWEVLQQAIDDILEFYFGDDARMKLAAQ